jgi:hypothetical protein
MWDVMLWRSEDNYEYTASISRFRAGQEKPTNQKAKAGFLLKAQVSFP